MRRRTIGIIALVFMATSAQAGDGILEINSTCAVQTGCFPGDQPGYPVTITSPGSYRLTSNLSRLTGRGGELLDANTIQITAFDVTLDLGGFAITCSHFIAGQQCLGDANGVSGPFHIRTAVKNGSIAGMPSSGVYLGHEAQVTNLQVGGNRGHGIQVGAGSTVSGNTVRSNGFGIRAADGSVISGNTVVKNTSGITALSGSVVAGNTATHNQLGGITAGPGSIVQGNTIRENANSGLGVAPDTGYRENVITDNGSPAGSSNVVPLISGETPGVNMGANSCDGTPSCP